MFSRGRTACGSRSAGLRQRGAAAAGAGAVPVGAEAPDDSGEAKGVPPAAQSRQCRCEVRIPRGRTPAATRARSAVSQSARPARRPGGCERSCLGTRSMRAASPTGSNRSGAASSRSHSPRSAWRPGSARCRARNGATAGLRQHAFRLGDAVFGQPRPREVGARQRHDPPTGSGCESSPAGRTRLVRDQQQGGSGRRLLERLSAARSRRRSGIASAGRITAIFAPRAMAGHLRTTRQVADRVDPITSCGVGLPSSS